MTEHPILFNGPLVRAILRDVDPKTQTRRLITRLRGFGKVREFGRSDTPGYDWTFRDHRGLWNDISDKRLREVLPYQVGDRLWVRETWQAIHVSIDPETGYGDDLIVPSKIPKNDDDGFWKPVYAATDEQASYHKDDRGFCWRPAIHMPRWASRIDLEVTAVRVQRLWDITEDDAKAEGVTPLEHVADEQRIPGPGFDRARHGDQPHRFAFALKWEEIYGEETWFSNPWVWVIGFKRIRP